VFLQVKKIVLFVLVFCLSLSCRAESIVFHSVTFDKVPDKNGLYQSSDAGQPLRKFSIEHSATSTVAGRLNVDLQTLVPPLVLEPVDVIRSKSRPNDDVIISAITYKGKGKYGVILARLINTKDGLQAFEVDAVYALSRWKKFKEYKQVKAELVKELFELQE